MVRVSWDAPAEGAVGITYDVWRDGEQILTNSALCTRGEAPPTAWPTAGRRGRSSR